MSTLVKKLRERFDPGTIAFVSRINIYGFGLMVFWTVTNIMLLPTRVEETVRESFQGTALGLISFLGVGFAVIVQPIAGRISDAWPGKHSRLPFIVAGTLLVIPGLFFFGTGVRFWALLVGFVAMQLGTNIAQAAFQAFIPDLVSEENRGIASGAKNILSVLGAALGLIGAQGLILLNASSGWVVVYIGVVLVLTGALTIMWVPTVSGGGTSSWRASVLPAMNPRNVWNDSVAILRKHQRFRLGVLAQFLFMLGNYPAQRFLLLFLKDRFGDGVINVVAPAAVIAIVLAVLSAGIAGLVSDIVGRAWALIVAAVIGSIGMMLMGFSLTLFFAAAAGGLIAVGYGAFLSVNWALLNDDLPEEEAAAALGVANIATAGAGAAAGLFGPIVDLMNAWLPQGTYQTLFGLAGIVALIAIMPLRDIRRIEGAKA